MPYFTNILFDADGLVINSPRFSDRLRADYQITWDKMKPFFEGSFQQCKLGRADLKTELAKVVNDWGWRGTVDELVTYWFTGDVLNQEIIKVIASLRNNGTKCYLASNQERSRAAYLNHQLGFGKIFDGQFLSHEIGYLKNQVEFFNVVQSRLDKGPTLFIDHDQENLDAAKMIGISTFLFHSIQELKEYLNQA